MKKQNFVSTKTLKEEFNNLKAENASEAVASAIEALSRVLKDLQEIGVNVQLQFSKTVFEDVFSLVKECGGAAQSTVSASGLLKIDDNEFLLVLAVKEDDNPVLKMYVSHRDFSARSLRSDYRGLCFDLNEDAEAMHKFQQYILQRAAQNEFVREHDVCDSFHGVTRLNKNVLTRDLRPSSAGVEFHPKRSK